jgi:hypothetical protein
MNPSYIAPNVEELMDAAPADIQNLLDSGEVAKTAAIIGKVYQIQIGLYVALSNVIVLTLIGALKPENVTTALVDLVKVTPDTAYKIAGDLEKSILQKARISVLGQGSKEVQELVFQGERSPDELRKEILDTTKRESGLVKDQSTEPIPAVPKKQVVLTPGSRSQLLEQLQILGSIPNDEEVEARLSHIQEQIASIDTKEDNTLDANVPLQNFLLGEQGKGTADAKIQPATYSAAPTKYNVDPYREIAEV